MDRYPTQRELNKVEKYDLCKRPVETFLEYLRSIWWTPEWGFKLKGKRILRLELHCGGWSGNESIINALERNVFFYTLWWEKSYRGGHYYFKIKPILKNKGVKNGKI